jgi:replicative DNA helicase
LARELGVPVILLAQLSRKADEPNRKPRLSDLKESGGLEQDADIVLGLWRKDDEKIEERTLSVLKQRNGRVGDIDLKFEAHLQRFTNQPRLN